MTERTHKWREIFGEITADNGYYEFGKVNFYKLTSLIEDLYVRIEELEDKLNDKGN